jgi:hypothetical protein
MCACHLLLLLVWLRCFLYSGVRGSYAGSRPHAPRAPLEAQVGGSEAASDPSPLEAQVGGSEAASDPSFARVQYEMRLYIEPILFSIIFG